MLSKIINLTVFCITFRVKRATFKTLVDEVQELEAKSEDPGAVVHGKRYCKKSMHQCLLYDNKISNNNDASASYMYQRQNITFQKHETK